MRTCVFEYRADMFMVTQFEEAVLRLTPGSKIELTSL